MDQFVDDRQKALFERFDALGISHVTHRHAPVYTVEEAQKVRDEAPGAHTKNLFLKDKKDNFFLIVAEETAEVDLKSIHTQIGAQSRVSFGKPEKLMDYLGVEPGSVTAFGVINDREGRVRVFIDETLMNAAVINAHPLTNDATTAVSRDDLIRFLEDCGHAPTTLKLGA